MNINRIKIIIQENMGLLRSKYNVESIGVFGSVGRGKERQSSDVDILVEFFEPIGFFKFIELEEFLGQLIGRRIDLVTKKALKPAIRKDILKEVVYV